MIEIKGKAVKMGSILFRYAYKKARNNLNKLIKDTKANYYNNAMNSCNKDPKSMWKTINQLIRIRKQQTIMIE